MISIIFEKVKDRGGEKLRDNADVIPIVKELLKVNTFTE
jgi:hypothetical protein